MIELRAALAQFHTGFQPFFPFATVLLAEVESGTGSLGSAIRLLDDLLIDIERTGQRWFDAEVHRQRGEVFLQSGTGVETEAETTFQAALAVARKQHVKTFELRAAVRLARLWRDQGKKGAALEVLGPICEAVPKGLVISDLRDAEALMETLI